MKGFKSIQISAKEVKSEMKFLGIKVLRSAQNKSGVIITIVNTPRNQQKTVEYFRANNMSISPFLGMNVVVNLLDYIDFGTIYKWIEV